MDIQQSQTREKSTNPKVLNYAFAVVVIIIGLIIFKPIFDILRIIIFAFFETGELFLPPLSPTLGILTTIFGVFTGIIFKGGFWSQLRIDISKNPINLSAPQIILSITAILIIGLCGFLIGKFSEKTLGLSYSIGAENWIACTHIHQGEIEDKTSEIQEFCSKLHNEGSDQTHSYQPNITKIDDTLYVHLQELQSKPVYEEELDEYWTDPIQTLRFCWNPTSMKKYLQDNLSGKPLSGISSTLKIVPATKYHEEALIYCRYIMNYKLVVRQASNFG